MVELEYLAGGREVHFNLEMNEELMEGKDVND